MEADLKKELDVEVELIAGSGGVFEVSCDGEMVFSRKQEGRFPKTDEILARLKR